MKTARNAERFAGLLLEDGPRAAGGWLFYDAACPFCTRLAQRIAPRLRRAQIETLPLQTPWVERLMDERRQDLLKEIRFLDRSGRLLGGADALIDIARRFWWARPFLPLTRLPGVLPLLRRSYAWIAARRHCAFRSKQVAVSPWVKWSPALLPPLASILAWNQVAPWQFMWLMAFALFAAAS